MALRAGRIAGRMRTRQTYRTMARMQRRRSGEQEESTPNYVAELEQLAQLRDRGVITADDFETKKKQLLGI
jgi:hypothetical protein